MEKFWKNFGESISYDDVIYTIDETTLKLNTHILKDFLEEYRDYANTPFGIMNKYFVKNNLLKEWLFSKEHILAEFDTCLDAQNALKGLEVYSLTACDMVPPFYWSKAEANKAIRDLYTEEEIKEKLR